MGRSHILWANQGQIILKDQLLPIRELGQEILGEPDARTFGISDGISVKLADFQRKSYEDLPQLFSVPCCGDIVTPEMLGQADVIAFEKNGTAAGPSGGWESCDWIFSDKYNSLLVHWDEAIVPGSQAGASLTRDPHVIANGSISGTAYGAFFGIPASALVSGTTHPDDILISFLLFRVRPQVDVFNPDFAITLKGVPPDPGIREATPDPDAVGVLVNFSFCSLANAASPLGPPTFDPPDNYRWERGNLTWSIDPRDRADPSLREIVLSPSRPPPPTEATAEAVLVQAFDLWLKASQQDGAGGASQRRLKLTRAAPDTVADIPITFGLLPAGQEQGIGVIPGQGGIILRSDRTWSAQDLLDTALHMIGHSLGLKDDSSGLPITTTYELTQAPQIINPWGSEHNLTWSINTTGCNFALPPLPTLPAVVANAFARWQIASPFFSFTKIAPHILPTDPVANIPITFGHVSEGIHQAKGGIPTQGDILMKSNRTWSAEELLNIALHEIGHSLGLKHSPSGHSIMNPTTSSLVDVDPESKEVLHLLYGWTPDKDMTDDPAAPVTPSTSDHGVLGVTASMNFTGRSETPHMVWKGIPEDPGIYESELLETGWTPQQTIPVNGSSHSPALAEYPIPASSPPRTGLMMAWKGPYTDKHLYWTQYLDNRWEDWQPFDPPELSDTRPALATVAGIIYVACAGSGEDRQIYWSSYDEIKKWPQFKKANDFRTSDSPALVGMGNRLYMFWKRETGTEASWSWIEPGAPNAVWAPQKSIEYRYTLEHGIGVSAIGTGKQLSAAQCGDTIFLAWRGILTEGERSNDDHIYITVFSKDVFGGPIQMPFRTSDGPAVTKWGDGILMAWKGKDDHDRTIHWSKLQV